MDKVNKFNLKINEREFNKLAYRGIKVQASPKLGRSLMNLITAERMQKSFPHSADSVTDRVIVCRS